MTAPNIVNVTSIYGKTALANVTTARSSLVQNPASSNSVYKINNIIVSNIDGANIADITASVLRSGGEYRIASTITIPADATLVVLSKESAIYLEEGDAIALTASANNDLQAVCSYEVIS